MWCEASLQPLLRPIECLAVQLHPMTEVRTVSPGFKPALLLVAPLRLPHQQCLLIEERQARQAQYAAFRFERVRARRADRAGLAVATPPHQPDTLSMQRCAELRRASNRPKPATHRLG